MEETLVSSMWGSRDCDWSVKDAEGRSGGLLTIWRSNSISPEFSFRCKRYLGLKALWKGTTLYCINNYSPCNLAEKRDLWLGILGWKNKLEKGELVVDGDFNSINSREERKGLVYNSRCLEMEEFRSFIDAMELVDVPVLGGNIFTWFKPDGKACSRLDRILLSEGLVSKWGVMAREGDKHGFLRS